VKHGRSLAAVAKTLVFIPLAALFLWMSIKAAQVTVDCSHAEGRCVVTHRLLGLPWTHGRFPLYSVVGLRLVAVRSKAGNLYGLEVETRDGTIPLSWHDDLRGVRVQQQQAVESFLGHESAPPLHMLYDAGDPLQQAVWLLMALVFAVGGLTFLGASSLILDWSAGRLVVEKTLWPWSRRRRRSFDLAHVARVRVEEREADQPKRRHHLLVLVMEDGTEVSLEETRSDEVACFVTANRVMKELRSKGT
jgi:hypothetical protein